jgi:hypothetical protein
MKALLLIIYSASTKALLQKMFFQYDFLFESNAISSLCRMAESMSATCSGLWSPLEGARTFDMLPGERLKYFWRSEVKRLPRYFEFGLGVFLLDRLFLKEEPLMVFYF